MLGPAWREAKAWRVVILILLVSFWREIETWKVSCTIACMFISNSCNHEGSFISLSAYVFIRFLYRLYVYPIFLSPLRKAPGPPYGHWLLGQLPKFTRQGVDPMVTQREWMKEYGDSRGILRDIGPFGVERIMFLSTQATHKILVSDWLDYPRVRSSFVLM